MNPSPESNPTRSQFEKLLAGLARSGVDFAVVRGGAVIANGCLRLTEDLDILVSGPYETLSHRRQSLVRASEAAGVERG